MGYVNDLRKRAYSDKASAPISDSDFTLDFMMDERARELFYEAQRRTDLIRFGKYTSADYVWPWKGGVAAGKSVESFYQVFPCLQTMLVLIRTWYRMKDTNIND